jgi:hypothetical protein
MNMNMKTKTTLKKENLKVVVMMGIIVAIVAVLAYSYVTTPMSAFYPKYNAYDGPMQECAYLTMTATNGTTSSSDQNNCILSETSWSSGQTYDPCVGIQGCVNSEAVTTSVSALVSSGTNSSTTTSCADIQVEALGNNVMTSCVGAP